MHGLEGLAEHLIPEPALPGRAQPCTWPQRCIWFSSACALVLWPVGAGQSTKPSPSGNFMLQWPNKKEQQSDAGKLSRSLEEEVPQNNEKLQESPCIFALTPRQVELIRNSRELQPGVKAVQVVLRICYSDTSCPQEDQYPPNIAVKVNHSYCSVPGYYPSNKPGVEPKRPCRPINLTHLMYLSSATNRITVTWGNYGKSYSVALYLVRQLTSSELLQRLKTIGVKHPELCKALVKEKLRLDPDSEIATTGVRVSLICPLVKMRLSVPCRAETCAHLQCFDAVFYLQMNEKKPTWMCPVCDKPAPYDQLIIDGLLSKILSECEDADEIEYLVDGSWCPIRAEKERSCSPQGAILVLGECLATTNRAVPSQGRLSFPIYQWLHPKYLHPVAVTRRPLGCQWAPACPQRQREQCPGQHGWRRPGERRGEWKAGRRRGGPHAGQLIVLRG
ncbi:PREDICTED: E3 SUMO-protein ligase PIAS4 isoform X10 [Cercocebus atys]|uniref:E3 SUMO-protein ligase PIAS4 isoform X10 n=1 Tax=Cercocebus atys TaxID=9531 RepID=UPI0005F48BEF|nr:PREDICTED: E3 SUMO-protein ligase PIAS4 isoform X10 [Cercocebus atys]